MKKCIAFVAALVCLAVMMVPFTCCADGRQDILTKLEEVIPKHYHKYYMPTARNLLAQITVSDKQAAGVNALLDELYARFDKDRGMSVHNYSEEQQVFFVQQFEKAMDILNLTYKCVDVGTVYSDRHSDHGGDIVYLIYDANGRLIAQLDGDIEKTDVAEDYTVYAAIGAALLAMSLVAFVATRKVTAR